MQKGKLYIVATPIGNLNDFSPRAIETLNNVDLIIAEDTRTSGQLLKHFNISTNCESYHKFNETSKSKTVIQYLLDGKNIALISDAGTPGISDPGNVLVQECKSENIEVIPIPGCCAFIQALICSGFNTINFSFFGFIPVEKKERKIVLNTITNCSTNLAIIYEAPHRLVKTLTDLFDTFGDLQISISKEITKMYESHERTTIKEAINKYTKNAPKGEFVIVVELPKEVASETSLEDKNIQEKILKRYEQLKDYLSVKDISKMLSEDLNISKNDIYSFISERKK